MAGRSASSKDLKFCVCANKLLRKASPHSLTIVFNVATFFRRIKALETVSIHSYEKLSSYLNPKVNAVIYYALSQCVSVSIPLIIQS